jgi:MFS family permease
MALAQSLTAIIIFWAIIGGLGASLLLPAMQSLIHGNFEGAAQKQAYALVGAAAAIAAAVGPLLGGFITTYLSWRVAFLLEDLVIAIVLSASSSSATCRTPGRGQSTSSAPACRSWAWAASCWASWCGRRAASPSARCWRSARSRWRARLLARAAQARREADAARPDLFKSKLFRFGISQQMLQQIALGGTMIALPIFLQMVLEYNADGGRPVDRPALAQHVRHGAARRQEGGRSAPSQHHPGLGFALPGTPGLITLIPARAAGQLGLVPSSIPLIVAGRAGPAGVPAQQLHAVPDRRGARQRGRPA